MILSFPSPDQTWQKVAVSVLTGKKPGRQTPIEVQRGPLSGAELAAKRLFDLVLALLATLLLLPLFVLLNIAIKLDSRGPVILRQRRYGFDRNEFTAYSFRTTHWQGGGGAVRQSQPNILGQPNDDDLTRIGRVLRTAGIDKLPQLLNVLRGDMSLVGPLPPAHAHGDEHTKALADYAFRHRIRPGITGLAQIGEVRSTDQVELIKQIAILELWYVNNWSIWLDLKIVVRSCLERTRPQDSFETTTDRNPRQSPDLSAHSIPKWQEKERSLPGVTRFSVGLETQRSLN